MNWKQIDPQRPPKGEVLLYYPPTGGRVSEGMQRPGKRAYWTVNYYGMSPRQPTHYCELTKPE